MRIICEQQQPFEKWKQMPIAWRQHFDADKELAHIVFWCVCCCSFSVFCFDDCHQNRFSECQRNKYKKKLFTWAFDGSPKIFSQHPTLLYLMHILSLLFPMVAFYFHQCAFDLESNFHSTGKIYGNHQV